MTKAAVAYSNMVGSNISNGAVILNQSKQQTSSSMMDDGDEDQPVVTKYVGAKHQKPNQHSRYSSRGGGCTLNSSNSQHHHIQKHKVTNDQMS